MILRKSRIQIRVILGLFVTTILSLETNITIRPLHFRMRNKLGMRLARRHSLIKIPRHFKSEIVVVFLYTRAHRADGTYYFFE